MVVVKALDLFFCAGSPNARARHFPFIKSCFCANLSDMFGLGLPEIIIILIVALLVVGPAKLPELAKTLGKAFNDFRKMADEVKETFDEEVVEEEPKKVPETKEPEETAEGRVPTAQEARKDEPPEQGGKTDAKAT